MQQPHAPELEAIMTESFEHLQAVGELASKHEIAPYRDIDAALEATRRAIFAESDPDIAQARLRHLLNLHQNFWSKTNLNHSWEFMRDRLAQGLAEGLRVSTHSLEDVNSETERLLKLIPKPRKGGKVMIGDVPPEDFRANLARIPEARRSAAVEGLRYATGVLERQAAGRQPTKQEREQALEALRRVYSYSQEAVRKPLPADHPLKQRCHGFIDDIAPHIGKMGLSPGHLSTLRKYVALIDSPEAAQTLENRLHFALNAVITEYPTDAARFAALGDARHQLLEAVSHYWSALAAEAARDGRSEERWALWEKYQGVAEAQAKPGLVAFGLEKPPTQEKGEALVSQRLEAALKLAGRSGRPARLEDFGEIGQLPPAEPIKEKPRKRAELKKAEKREKPKPTKGPLDRY